MYARVLRAHFHPEVTMESQIEAMVTPDEMQMLQDSPHRWATNVEAARKYNKNSYAFSLA